MQKILFVISLLYASTFFEHYVLIIRRSKFYYIASGIITPVGGRPVQRLRQPLSTCVSDGHLQSVMMTCCIIQFSPSDDEHIAFETCTGIE